MIRHIPHAEIDIQKYDDCIINSSYPVIFASSEYLNIASNEDWDLLVLGDYEVVMPIPYDRMKRSFWKKSVVQPYLCQQLGVFSKKEITQEIFASFFSELLGFNPVVYHFNHGNLPFLLNNGHCRSRTNYVLHLNKSYEELFANYSTSKRQTVRKTKKNNLNLVISNNVEEFLALQKKIAPFNESKKVELRKKNLMLNYIANKKGKLLLAVDDQNEIIAGIFVILWQQRIYYLQSFSNSSGRDLLAVDMLLNHIIEQYANKNYTLDFEGSEIPGIAKFFASFGAKKENFSLFQPGVIKPENFSYPF